MSRPRSTQGARRATATLTLAAVTAVGAWRVWPIAAAALAGRASASERDPKPTDSRRIRVEGQRLIVPDDVAAETGIETQVASTRTEPVTLRLTGRTGLNQDTVAHVHLQFPGRVAEIGPQLGALVRGPEDGGPPTVLVRIESTDLSQAKSDYLKARVQEEQDRDWLRRTEELFDAKVLSDKAIFDANAAVRKSEADFQAARQRLLVFGLSEADIAQVDRQQGRERMIYDLPAPRSGVITEKNVTRGENVDATVNLFTISDTATLWVWGDVYERDRSRVRVGQKLLVSVASSSGPPRECAIDWISPVIDGTTRSVRIRGVLDNRDGALLADMFATLVVVTADGENSLIVPEEALVRTSQGATMFVRVGGRDGGAVYERRAVKAEAASVGRARITEGLAPGETIVVRGALGLATEVDRR